MKNNYPNGNISPH